MKASPPPVLFVDDDRTSLEICTRMASRLGYQAVSARSSEEAEKLLAEREFGIVVTDIRMPGRDGFELARHIATRFPKTAVAMMTSYGTIDEAVAAMRAGVLDYITKPFDFDGLSCLLGQLTEWRDQIVKRRSAAATTGIHGSAHGIIGESRAMQDVLDRIERAASVDSTVLIQGESGTGKELVARAVHRCSSRSGGPFLPCDCGGLSQSLVESELFGHEKGAFTGADRARPGILRAAEGGTVFLDEIGEVPVSAQARFLRALQEKEVRSVGGFEPVPFDARVIAATNRNLQDEIIVGTFRKDLFYRLHVIPIHVPPLRERARDIPLLVDAFLERHSSQKGRQIEIEPEAMRMLVVHDWPGNVRELQNCIECACVLRSGQNITPEDLPADLQDQGAKPAERSATDGAIRSLAEYEEEAIREALKGTDNNKKAAAKALGVSVPTLYAKIRKYGIAEISKRRGKK